MYDGNTQLTFVHSKYYPQFPLPKVHSFGGLEIGNFENHASFPCMYVRVACSSFNGIFSFYVNFQLTPSLYSHVCRHVCKGSIGF